MRAVASAIGCVAENKNAAARLRGVVAIARQQNTVPVADSLRPAQLQDAVDPFRRLGPTEAAGHRPSAAEDLFDGSDMSIRQTSIDIPFLDPVQPQTQAKARSRASSMASCGGVKGSVKLGLVGHIAVEANSISGEALPHLGKETAVLVIAAGLIGGPVQELDAQARAMALSFGHREFQCLRPSS